MSDLKVSCPGCGQHIAYDANWAGRQINCPTCQTAMTIPGGAAPPAPPPPPRPAVGPPPPPQSAGPQGHRPVPGPARAAMPALSAARRTSGMAVASLVCGLVFCVPLLTSVAGVICGHIARGQIRRDGSLKGSGMALTGLITGYVFGGLWVAWLILLLLVPGSMLSAFKQEVEKQQQLERQRQQGTSPGTREKATPPTTTSRRTRPAPRAGNEEKLPQPENPVKGTIGASDFACDSAVLEGGWLKLRQGGGFMADQEVQVVLFAANAEIEGKTYTIAPGGQPGTTPHIHYRWKEGGTTKSGVTSGKYTMTLRFEKFEEGTVRGEIDLVYPGAKGVTVKGNFAAKVK